MVVVVVAGAAPEHLATRGAAHSPSFMGQTLEGEGGEQLQLQFMGQALQREGGISQ